MIYRGASDVVSAIVVDNGALFAASRDNAIRAWELKSGRVLQVYAGHSSWVRCIAVNSFKLYSGSNDGTVKEWDVKVCLASIPTHAPTPELTSLVYFDYCLQTGDCLRTFSGHTGAVSCMQRKGNLLYTGSDDGTVRVWNIDSPAEFGHCVHIYKGHEGMISCLKLHEDLLYTGSYDRTVRVYKNVQ
jgi:WD40 repeat protein